MKNQSPVFAALLVVGAFAATGCDGVSGPAPAQQAHPSASSAGCPTCPAAADGPSRPGRASAAVVEHIERRIEATVRQWREEGLAPSEIATRRQRLLAFLERVRSGEWRENLDREDREVRVADFRVATERAVARGDISETRGESLLREYVDYQTKRRR